MLPAVCRRPQRYNLAIQIGSHGSDNCWLGNPAIQPQPAFACTPACATHGGQCAGPPATYKPSTACTLPLISHLMSPRCVGKTDKMVVLGPNAHPQRRHGRQDHVPLPCAPAAMLRMLRHSIAHGNASFLTKTSRQAYLIGFEAHLFRQPAALHTSGVKEQHPAGC